MSSIRTASPPYHSTISRLRWGRTAPRRATKRSRSSRSPAPDPAAGHLVLVAGADAALGRADLRIPQGSLPEGVEGEVVGHDQVGGRADEELLVAEAAAEAGEGLDLLEQHGGIDDHAVADDAQHRGAHGAGREQGAGPPCCRRSPACGRRCCPPGSGPRPRRAATARRRPCPSPHRPTEFPRRPRSASSTLPFLSVGEVSPSGGRWSGTSGAPWGGLS